MSGEKAVSLWKELTQMLKDQYKDINHSHMGKEVEDSYEILKILLGRCNEAILKSLLK